MNQVVVTGMGVLTSVGTGVDNYWNGLTSGKSGITAVNRFDSSDIASKVASEINDFNPEEGDLILIDRDSFGLGRRFSLKTVSGKKSVNQAKEEKNQFIYDDQNGRLYLNENRREEGWGEGGFLLRIKGSPELLASDIVLL